MKKGSQKRAFNMDAKELIARYARGNVSLQLGRFVTAEEKAARRKAVLAMKFA
jgi:hypothetical protein